MNIIISKFVENDITKANMNDENCLNDEILWSKAVSGDAEAEETLVKKYNVLVKICSRPYFLAGGDSEDLVQEGMLGLLAAIRQFDPDRDASFKTYAEHCIRNRLYTAIKSASRFKHTPLNDYVSFESPQFNEIQTKMSSVLRDPEELLITRERVDEITEKLTGKLSGFESKVLELFLEGRSYGEIAERLGKTPKSVDNAVQRIRKKVVQII